MKRQRSRRMPLAVAFLAVSMLAALSAGVTSAQAPSIEGTYRLVSRTLRDGTVIKPPDEAVTAVP